MYSKFAYNLFIFAVLMIIMWFCLMRKVMNTNYQRAFRRMLICLLIANVARILTFACWEFGFHNDLAVEILMALFYCAFMHVFSFFYDIVYCVIHQDNLPSIKRRILRNVPMMLVCVFYALNPVFHWAFVIQNDMEVIIEPFYYLHTVVAIGYSIPSVYVLYQNHKYLPKNLIKCIIMLIILYCASEFVVISEKSSEIFMSGMTVGVMLLMFALLSFENFWNRKEQMMNKLALYTYLDRLVEKNTPSTLYMIKIVGYQYFDEYNDQFKESNMIGEIRSMLQKIAPVNNMYYVGDGRVILVIDEEDHVDEVDFLDKLQRNCNRNKELNGATFVMNIDIYVMRMPQDLKSVTELKEYLKYNRTAMQIRDMEEKVHIYRGGQLDIQRALRVRLVEEAIGRALENKSFQVYYQPIYSIKEGNIHSAEALIRLIDKEMGFIPPDEFIPIAEQNGAIMEIGLQVFESVCQFWHNERLRERGIEYIEVNLSMEQFMDDLLCYKLMSIMEKYEIPKSALNLEITETATLYEEVKLRRQMKYMSERGFLFSLDDYGTGYSNMESVMEYPLSLVKLDKSIVWSAQTNEKSMITMESLIQMFHCLGMKIVAEGVETEKQQQMLVEMGCDYIQGYLYSRPITKDEFLEYVEDFNRQKISDIS